MIPGTMLWRTSVEGAVYTNSIVVAPECVELSVKVDRIPEKGMVQVFAPDGYDQSFHERVRHRGVWHRLDLFDLEDSLVRHPSMKAEQWVVIRADPSGQGLSGNGPIEHAAHRRAADTKADYASGEHIHDHQDPMTAQQYRLATKQINAPKGCPWPVR